MKDLKIKICGMTEAANVAEISGLHPDYLGYIFYTRSLRYVGDKPDPAIFEIVPPGTRKVAVFVNEYLERMIEITTKYGIDMIQLHGMEPPETCKTLKSHGISVIKVFPGDQISRRSLISEYERCSDFFLYDTPVKTYGGSGRKFDWKKLDELVSRKPFFLSGGIEQNDAAKLMSMKLEGFYAADINSRFEIEPGIKDPKLVSKFIREVRHE